MRHTQSLLAAAAFAIAALLCYFGAVWGVGFVEARSVEMVHQRLSQAGLDWVKVAPDGLLLNLTGTAPTEAARLRAISVASSVVDPNRVQGDGLAVTPPKAIEAPRFSLELLRNEDGISLIGLVPKSTGHDPILDKVTPLVAKGKVTDMLETADYPAPASWNASLKFGLAALGKLPRSKISIGEDRVAVTAITDSGDAKRRLEAELARMAPQGVRVALDISAPRPVITPFTLRFVVDKDGARFDACSADTVEARARILAEGADAGVKGKVGCTVGLGVPSPQWADAAVEGIRAVKALGDATLTISDTDVTLLAGVSVNQASFDRVVGDLGARLPDVFSLKAKLTEKKKAEKGPVEFTATLSPEGEVQLRGRLGSELNRDAVTSFARAAFPDRQIYNAARLDKNLPDGWPVRVLAGLRALSFLHHGALLVTPETVDVSGVAGNKNASDEISRVLSDKLGQGKAFKIAVKYDKALDPETGKPTPQECVDNVTAILKKHQINFDPGSDRPDAESQTVLDRIADVLRPCADVPIEIAGYTDNQGRSEMNLRLSQQRAEAVLNGLLSRRVPVSNFHAKGYGEADPIADNSTEAGREANRRIEFSLMSDKKAGASDGGGSDTAAPADGSGDQSGDQSGDAGGDAAAGAASDQAPANLPDGSGDEGADATQSPAGAAEPGNGPEAPQKETKRPELRPTE